MGIQTKRPNIYIGLEHKGDITIVTSEEFMKMPEESYLYAHVLLINGDEMLHRLIKGQHGQELYVVEN